MTKAGVGVPTMVVLRSSERSPAGRWGEGGVTADDGGEFPCLGPAAEVCATVCKNQKKI